MPGNGALKRFKDKVSASIGRTGKRPASSGGANPRHDPEVAQVEGTDGTGRIAVGYAPERDGDADPGEVVWTWVAYEDDPTQGKDRPVLVLGWDGPLLAAVQLSSKDHSERPDAHEWVEVGRGAWDSQNRISYANADRLLRIEPNAVRREGAAVHPEAYDRVLARVAQLHDWVRRSRGPS